MAQKVIDKNFSEKKELAKAKKISIEEGSLYAVSEGTGMRYITPFALSLGASNAHIGFMTSLPSLIGNFSELLTPRLMEKVTRKKIVFYGALLQAFAWLFIIGVGVIYFYLGVDSAIAPTILIVIYTLLVLFGSFLGPAWNSWMRDIVKGKIGRYFGNRSRIVGGVALASMLVGGFILDYFKNTKIFLGFMIVFGLAFLARSISAFLFLRQYEPKLELKKSYYFSFWDFVKNITKNNFGKFVLFISLVHFAAAIASPFFSVYMLKDLQFNYLRWVIVIVASSVSTLFFLPVWGKFADKYGNIKVIRIGSFLIPFVPLLWLAPSLGISNVFYYLVIVEIFSGFVWAGFNLSSTNFIYEDVTREKMALCVAYFSIIQGVGIFIGASLGGLVSSSNFTLFGLAPIATLFLISLVLRFGVAIAMHAKVSEIRKVPKFSIEKKIERVTALHIGKFWKHLEITLRPRHIHV
jgi:MFS family permease